MDERVQKILSQWGIASRRQAEQMIQEGRVSLNGIVAQLGQRANPATDRLEVDGVVVRAQHRPDLVYLLLNKPAGVVSTCTDPWGRTTVIDLLPSELTVGQGLHPVGRLDADSTGALLVTNDGDLTYLLTHPRHHIPKTYEVWVAGQPSAAKLQQWRRGVLLEGRQTLPAEVTVLDYATNHKTHLQIVLVEGRNRQIRRVAEQLGHPVLHVHRTAIGPIQLKVPGKSTLPSGSYRFLDRCEIGFLNVQIDLPSERMPANEECHP
jgi:pseudouridine synthase